MDIRELTDILVKSSQRTNQSKYIPWWEDDFENCIYRYDIFGEEEVRAMEACIAECGREALTAPVGSYGLTLLHLLVWHNFYDAVSKLLCEGKIEGEEINMPDHKGHGITPFLLACCRGNLAMAQLLLENGADASLCDEKGRGVYHYLARPRCLDLVNVYACTENSVMQREAIARLLENDIDQKDAEGVTPFERLLLSSDSSNYSWALADVFLEKGAKTDYVDENGNTLLMIAIKNNHMTAAVGLMEKCGDMVNIANKDGVTPLQQAAKFYNQGLCLALLDHGAAPSDEVRRMSIGELSQITGNAFGRVSDEERDGITLALYLTKKLIKMVDADDDDEMRYIVNIFHNALIADKKCMVLDACREAGLDFTAPIHSGGSATCLRDQCLNIGSGVRAIRKLIELGVDMDRAVIGGQTPANIIACGHSRNSTYGQDEPYFGEAAELLSKESMEELDNGGRAAIHNAVANGLTGMLKVMIEKGVDVNLTEDEPAQAGNTPLHEACIHGNAEEVRLLLAAGADDTMRNPDGETPAHFAVMKKKSGRELQTQERAGLLTGLKNLDEERSDGRTPLMLLQLLDVGTNRELQHIFIERGADVNHVDSDGKTALMLNADNYCYKEPIKELIQAGADINMADKEGNTALYYALKTGDRESARYMIKKGADYNHPNNAGVTPVQVAVEKGYDIVLELMTDI